MAAPGKSIAISGTATQRPSDVRGDAFNGAFAVAIGEGRAPVEAMRFACARAALSVTKAGTAPSMPMRGEIDAMMAKGS
jgi:ribokinase